MMAALTFSQDDFLALGRQLADAAIVLYQQQLADHATTVNVPAPSAHPMIERIVKRYGGEYAIAPRPAASPQRDVAADIDALTAALVGKAVITPADVTAAAIALSAQASGAPASTASAGT